MSLRQVLHAEFGPYATLSDQQLQSLDQHFELLLRWNERLNLTRITDPEEAARFHYCESMFVGTILPPGPLAVADVGSGAGFPGVPIAVLRPDLKLVLIEADSRKAVFLREATRHLPSVHVSCCRFQDFPEQVDWAVSRALATEELVASGIAENFALLMANGSAPLGAKVIRLPWGRDRVLAVSRGTKAA